MPAQAAYQLVEGIHGLFVHDPLSEQSAEEWLEVARLLELRARHIRDGIKRSAYSPGGARKVPAGGAGYRAGGSLGGFFYFWAKTAKALRL